MRLEPDHVYNCQCGWSEPPTAESRTANIIRSVPNEIGRSRTTPADRPHIPDTGSVLFEAVTDAIECLNHVEGLIHRLQLPAQPLDVAVDGPLVNENLVVTSRVH